MRILSPFLLFIFLLTACSSESTAIKKASGFIPDTLKGVFKRKKKDAAPSVNPLIGLTRSQFKDVPGPLLFAHLETSNAYASLVKIAENSGVQTFLTTDKVSLSLRNGIVLATRGIGADLLSADISESNQAVKSRGAKDYTRVMRWLDAQDQAQAGHYDCDMISVGSEKVSILGTPFSTVHLQETCRSEQNEFTNDYWVGRTKPVIWKSRQWLSQSAGYISLELLVE